LHPVIFNQKATLFFFASLKVTYSKHG